MRSRWTFLLLIAASLIYAELALRVDPKASFYGLPSRAWELLLGGSLALGFVPAIRTKLLAEILSAAGLALIAASVILFDANSSFPGLKAVPPCLGAACIIHANSRYDTGVGKALGLYPLVFCGLISYSLYLWHWPLLALGHYYAGNALSLFQSLMIVFLSFVIAAASWRFVERPFRQAKFYENLPAARAAVLAVSCLAVFLIIAGAVFQETQGLPGRVSDSVLAAERAKQHLYKIPTGCVPIKQAHFPAGTCAFGAQAAQSGNYQIVLWGDSHAQHYLPAIASLSEAKGYTGISITKRGCPPQANGASGCGWRNQDILKLIESLRGVELVIVASAWSGGGGADEEIQRRGAEQIRTLINHISRTNIPVLIMGEVPRFNTDVPKCVARARLFGKEEKACTEIDRKIAEQGQSKVNGLFAELIQLPGVRLFSPLNHMCLITHPRPPTSRKPLISLKNMAGGARGAFRGFSY